MRIAYIALHLDHTIMSGGVGEKINTQLRLWRVMGHSARLFLLTPDQIDLPETETFSFSKQGGLRFPLGEISRSRVLSRLITSIEAYSPDIVYLRYGLYTFPLERLAAVVAPLVIELNTNDVDEYRHRGSFFYLANRLTRGIMLRRAAGMVAVSDEIERFPFNQRYKKPVEAIANGIELDRYRQLPAPSNDRPVLAFVGMPGFNWHGVDKLITLARCHPDLHFDIVGYSQNDIAENVPPNLRLHGFIPRENIKAILARADLALGTLAMHRNNMQEASPLKVREALAYGLPMVLAYNDTDLSNAGFDFLLQIPNTEDNVISHAQQIHDFAYAMRGRRADRAVLYERIDQRLKEEARLAFFRRLI